MVDEFLFVFGGTAGGAEVTVGVGGVMVVAMGSAGGKRTSVTGSVNTSPSLRNAR